MRIFHYVLIFVISLFLGANLQAQTQYVGPNNGDWFTPANWNNGLPSAGNDAQIFGVITVEVNSPLNVNFNITAYGNISATDAVTIATGGSVSNSGTMSFASTGSLTNSGTLQNFGTLTFAGTASFINETGASFTNTGSCSLQATLVNQGSITNNGTIDASNGTLQSGGSFNNNQILTTKSLTINTSSSFTNNYGAVLNITGATGLLQVNGSFTNNGAVTASGVATVNGTFNNNVTLNVATATVLTVNAGAQLTNAGNLTNSGFIQNYGTLTNGQNFVNKGETNNFATFNNNNLVDNQTGASFFNRPGGTLGMGFGSKILNGGAFDNKNAINSFGTIENNGTFLNNGTLLSFGGSQLLNKSTFTNNNSISTNDVVTNDGTFTNNGTVSVNGGSAWSNNGTFTNATGGTVTVVQDFNNKPTGKLTNNGSFRNSVRTKNEGSFVNNAYLHNPGDFTNAIGATLTNNEIFSIEAGNLLNAGTFANTDKTIVDECSSMKNTGSINNTGGVFELHGILFQKGTLTGNALNNQGGYVHTAATSAAPTVCKNGTFGANIDGDIKVYANSIVAFVNFDSCANIVYLANGLARPVFNCSNIPTIQNVNLVVRTRLGDSLTCVAQVTPVDLLAPEFNTCPKDQVIFTPNPTTTATWTAPTATDNCSTVTLTSTHTPGSSFPVGITGVTYTVKDVYNNTNQCQFRIDVRQTPPGSNCTGDTAGPTFTGCPTNQTKQALGIFTPVSWTPPTPNDNCKPINLSSTHVPGQGFTVGTTTVTYTAKDGSNNSSTCTFTVTVVAVDPCLEDSQKPIIFGCPANIWLPTNPTINGAVAIWAAPGAGDNCGVTSLTGSHVPGAVFPVGTTTVTYTAKDAANNSATCSFVITVGADPCPGDATAPTISGCPANISLLTAGNSATATWTAPTATDNCAPVTVNNTHAPGATFPLGVTQVTYQFSDKKGNKSTCSFTVTVQNSCAMDNVPPVITGCPANITVAASGPNGATAAWTAPAATDNCGLSAFTSYYLPGATFPIGTTTVVYTAIDLKGNASNCSFNVNVVSSPNCTANAAPINNTTGVNPASATLSWTTAANASSYDVYLGTANPPTTTVATNVTGTSTTLTNLANGTTYFWFVVPKNAAGSATGCASNLTQFSTTGSTGGGGTGNCDVNTGSILREIWNTNTWNLNSIDGFGAPNNSVTLTQFALASTENGSNYMDRVRGFLVPSQTGNYRFNVTGDDHTELYLSTNASPTNKQKIAWHNGYTRATQYTKYASQTSNTVSLQAGKTYYIELRHLEGGGADHFRVSWKTPSNSSWNIVPGSKLAPYADLLLPNAICQNLNLQLTAIGQSVQINGQQVDNGSTPGCEATITSYNVSPNSFSQPGVYPVTLTVTNSLGLSANCTATVTVSAPACNGEVTGFMFTEANGTNLFALEDGGNYPLNTLPSSYNIQALVSGNSESAQFDLSGPIGTSHMENFLPYDMVGTGGSISLTPGNYTLTVKLFSEDNGRGSTCSQTTIHFKIGQNDPCAGAGLPPNAVCKNIMLQMTAPGQSVQISGADVDGGSTAVCGTITSLNVSPNSFSQPGTYTATLKVTNSKGLSSTCTATVTVLAAPCSISNVVCEANVNDAGWQNLNNCAVSACTGDKVILSVNPNGLPSYKWSGPGGFNATGGAGGDALISSSITNAQAGTYTVTLTDDNGCTATTSIAVTVTTCSSCNNVTSGGTIAKACANNQVSMSSVTLPSGGSGAIEYIWISGTVDCNPLNMAPVNGANSTTLTVAPPSATTYFIRCARRAGCTEWNGESNCITVNANECAPAGACVGNLLVNPGFENGTTSWTWMQNAGTTTSSPYAGSKSLQICSSAGGISQSMAAQPGANYNLNVYAKINSSVSWAGVGLRFYNASWTEISVQQAQVTTTNYTQYTVTATAPINAAYMEAWVWKNANGCFYADEFCMTATGGGNCNDKALLVVGSTSLNSGDAWVKTRLEQLGLTVTVKSASSSAASDANGKGVVIISSTVNSGDVGSKFTNVSVPVVTWESYLLDDLKMTGTSAQSDYGQNSSYRYLTISDASHPLAAGLSGNVKVYSSSEYVRWGWTTSNSAAKVAKVTGEEGWYGIFAFEKGGAMHGGFTAPARRVSLFLDDNTPTLLTTQGIQLFDAAIEWAVGCQLNHFNEEAIEYRSGDETSEAAITPSTSVQVFPNPAEDRIFLEFGEGHNEAAIVRLFDINGRAMKEWEVEASSTPVELQFDGLRSGQYLLWIAAEGKAPVSKRIIIATAK
ncbi:MAG: HYR domain-containing protein [Saprospiraceae bacterium]|nr:HYR domain-containing protein [Saprospiraceae bacterium]MCF8252731.1 HYR domain-containing protein [Saprospiraceae bacterium]MCF8283023.1 HYR domain-containing protein [Bacteroidales bacterium]MCF8314295.1 HYR domain-containing protein [Saprospiraceae bacterium]MCF8443148.1 HYR domain-containing protein [Saprospiraceae bacterium]